MVGATLSAIADSLPCCGFKLQYEVFSIVPLIPPNMNTTTNYADIFVRLPTNITSTIVIVFCYTSIVFRIERFRKNGSTDISDAHQTIEADYKYAMQFFAIAVTYSFTWISLRTVPLLTTSPPILALRTLIGIINFSTTGIVMLAVNSRVRGRALKMLGLRCCSKSNRTVRLQSHQPGSRTIR
ncbi:hypothetical protein Tcan_00255 [Toxocara canis]|uniref:7TM_GPCR_Srx domain-containing protein n=1 Tax=Toxocara canis TaxID=6265 RepID=A0A0B2V2E3_TOXCA|nr:hypothetical protein Tcan_00255 [Toxocara canis]